VLKWVTGHCNRAAVSTNRYDVQKTVGTHKILIIAIQFYAIDFFYMHLFTMRSQCGHPIRTLIVQDKNTSLKLPVGVSPLQLVNLHRNRKLGERAKVGHGSL
jgi:hypothetical protein